mgnify:CR=1 FL=1
MPFDEEEIRTLEESLISFRQSGPNERRSRTDQSDEEPTSEADVAHCLEKDECQRTIVLLLIIYQLDKRP